MLRITLRLLIAACGTAACSSPASPDLGTPPQGVVAGFVRDTAGRGVANAAVCASAVFSVFGTPVLLVNQSTTNANGAYLVPLNFTLSADVRARLTVAATPAVSSGLAPAYESGRTVLIAATPPPAETTYVTVVVSQGPPRNEVLCLSGP
jgi:hypothetical protein